MRVVRGVGARHPMKHETLAHLQQFPFLFSASFALTLCDIFDTLVAGICDLSRKPTTDTIIAKSLSSISF